MSDRKCPDCGGEFSSDDAFCPICGGDLNHGRIDARGRLLFFSTPFIFTLIGMAFAWDMEMENPVETGITIGLSFLSMVFLVTGGCSWILCRIFGFPFSSTFPWRAGMFGTLQLIASAILGLPLIELLMPGGMPALAFHDQDRLKIGIVFAIYLPLLLAGILLIVRRERLTDALGKPTAPGNPIVARFGSSPVFLGTLLCSVALVLVLPSYQKEFLFARVAGDFNKTEQALKNLDNALKEKPDFPQALNLKGLLLYGLAKNADQVDEAVAILRRAGELPPPNPRNLLSLAMVLDQSGKSEEASEVASRAVDLMPLDPTLWTSLAGIRLNGGNKKGAVSAYRKALQLDPDDPLCLNNLAFTLLEMNADVGSALELAQASVEKQPGYAYNQDTLGWALYKNGRFGDAYETIQAIKDSVGSVSPEIELHFAIIGQELGVLPEPRATFENLWEKPEVQSDPDLRNLVTEAIASLGVAIRGNDLVPRASSATALTAEQAPPRVQASATFFPPQVQASGSVVENGN